MTKKLPELRTMIQELVAKPSISSADPSIDQSNLNVIHILADWLETLGFNVEVRNISAQKANLIATLGNTRSGNGLVLSGHTDTVPFDDARWSTDPFKMTERDNRLYGLGCTDMKGFFAIAIEAVRRYSRSDFKQPLTILATADEESTMSGAKSLVNEGQRLGRVAVIGEPTNLRPVRMHKGVMMESISITGKSGHSSDPSLGANALEGMVSALSEVIAWRSEIQSTHRNPCFKVGVPTINLGSIRGGDNPNRICGHCETQIDIRILPGMEIDALRQDLRQRLQRLLDDQPSLSIQIKPLFDGVPAFETPADSSLVKTCEQLAGHAAESVAFGTEAPYLSQLGMETLVMGPGCIDQAHQPDEYLALDQLQPAIDLYSKLIEKYCVTAQRSTT